MRATALPRGRLRGKEGGDRQLRTRTASAEKGSKPRAGGRPGHEWGLSSPAPEKCPVPRDGTACPRGLRAFGELWGQQSAPPPRPGNPEARPSLQLDQQKRKQALALLRQRAKREVWETQKALDELLFKHQVQVRRGQAPRAALPRWLRSLAAWGPPAFTEGRGGEGADTVPPEM